MRARPLFFVLALAVAVFASRWLVSPPAGDVVDAPPPVEEQTASQGTAPLLVRDVVVRDVDGRVAWRGAVDLAPVLARIDAGERDPHRNDGAVFGNRERSLPQRAPGYYREYVVRTPGLEHAGPQRVIIGRAGDAWYTSDHYQTFRRIR